MADIFDKALLIGMGLEKKTREVLEELQKAGKKEAAETEGGEELPPRQVVENKVVSEGVAVLRELISAARGVKDKMEHEFTGASEKLLDKMGLPKDEEIDVAKEMARVAREKVDELEKKVADLEARLEGKGK